MTRTNRIKRLLLPVGMVALTFGAVLCLIGSIVLAVLFYWPVDPPYVPAEPLRDSASYSNGVLTVERYRTITWPAEITAFREIRRKGEQVVTRMESPDGPIILQVSGSEGRRRSIRILLEPGEFEVATRMCYEVFQIRKECMTLPTLPFTVHPGDSR